MDDIQGILALKALSYVITSRGNDDFISPVYKMSWPRGNETVTATCGHGRSHPSPNNKCNCGIWASVVPQTVVLGYGGQDDKAILLMEGWGKIIIYTEGFRCQYARMVAVLNVDHMFREMVPGIMTRQHMTNAVAQRYFGNLPLVSLDEANFLMTYHWLKDPENGEPPKVLAEYISIAKQMLKYQKEGGLDDITDESIGNSGNPIVVDQTSVWGTI